MIELTKKRVEQLFKHIQGKRILILGDLMVDRYFWGTVTRISPEAPVPVVEVERESTRLGGAANVGSNVLSLGATPIMVGVIGDDPTGRQLLRMLEDLNCVADGIVIDPSRPTTVKTRVIAHSQHVVRVDQESKADIAPQVQAKLLEVIRGYIDEIEAIIIEDYNKGVVIPSLIREVTELARSRDKIICVDPKFNNFFEFKGVTAFKPNRRETEEAMGVRLRDEVSVRNAGFELLRRLRCQCVLITLGEDGMALFERDGQMTNVPTKARRVHDVSGAGDTVISTFTVALAAGANFKEAATLANYAAGVVCGEVGIVPITREKLMTELDGRLWEGSSP